MKLSVTQFALRSSSSNRKLTSVFGLILAGITGAACMLHAQDLPQLPYPHQDAGLKAQASRAKEQQNTVSQFKVFYQFHFHDQLAQSGITFRHHATRYAGEHYIRNHYDHGTGVAVADVDGDGLYDIYFVNQVGGNELWKNLGGGKFRNITEEAGVALKDRISVGASFADVNNSGHPDLFVTTVNEGNVLFKNDGHGHFTDVTAEAGVGTAGHSSGAIFFDYDKDGLVDLLVTNVGVYTTNEKDPEGAYVGLPDAFFGHLHPERYEHPILYKNLGNYRFKDVTAEVGLNPHSWSGDADVADIDGTGYPGIYFPNMMGANHYFANQGGKRFVEKTSEYFPRTPWGAMGVKFFDYDNDGRLDLLVTDMHSDMMDNFSPEDEKRKAHAMAMEETLGGPASSFIFGNALYHNLGGGKFAEESDTMGAENLWPWGVSVADINADGYEDVFISSSMNYPFRYGINSMLLNNRGEKFLDAEFLLNIEPRQQPYTPWFEMDCTDHSILGDRGKDICGDETRKVMVTVPKGSRSAAIFDLNNDGALDIVTNDFNSEPQILVSDLAQTHRIHWLKIALHGIESNREGLGAWVRLTANGKTQTRYVDGKSGYLSQSDLPLYFGLGDATKAERIEVDWPSGRHQVVTKNLHANQTLAIEEPK